jgi:hypothetical protein
MLCMIQSSRQMPAQRLQAPERQDESQSIPWVSAESKLMMSSSQVKLSPFSKVMV